MKLLLTSSGITNASIHTALVEMLGKPISESSALIIPTAIYPFPGGANMAMRAINGSAKSPLCALGWKSLGILELTALPSIDAQCWVPTVRQTDALLLWGGDPLFLAYWMRQSGLASLFPSLQEEMVYVGVSAGSIAAAEIFGETYHSPQPGNRGAISMEEIEFSSTSGAYKITFVKAHGAGLVDFAIIPHFENPEFLDACQPNAEKWAARIPAPTYAIDDQSAIKVIDGNVEVISEGEWRLFH